MLIFFFKKKFKNLEDICGGGGAFLLATDLDFC